MQASRKPYWVAGLAVALLVVSSATVYFLLQPGNPYRGLDGDEIMRRVREANVSLEDTDMMLSNKQTGYSRAEQLFSELRELLPGEILPVRNLAILYVSQSLNATPQESEALIPKAEEVLNELESYPGEAALANYLRSRLIHKLAGEVATSQSLAAIDAALEAEPEQAIFWGWKAMMLENVRVTGEEAAAWQAERFAAVKRALELDPSNLCLAGLHYRLAIELESDEVVEAGGRFRELLRVLNYPVFVVSQRRSPVDLVDQTLGDVKEGNWDAAVGPAWGAWNLLKPLDTFKADMARAMGHPLDFMARRFSDDFMAGVTHTKDRPATVDIELGESQEIVALPDDGLAITVADVDLDRRFDLVVLTTTGLSVYRETDGEWAESLRLDLPSGHGFEHLLAVDLDQDDLAKVTEGEVGMGEESEPLAEYFEADPDFVLWGAGGTMVVINADEGGLQRHLRAAELPDVSGLGGTTALAAADIDLDADVDLVLGTEGGVRLWFNRGTGDFVANTTEQLLPGSESPVTSLAVVDWDRDLDLDLLTANGVEVGLLENLSHGRLRYRRLGEAETDMPATHVAFLEADGIPSWDLLASGADSAEVVWTETTPARVSRRGSQELPGTFGPRLQIDDLDNDSVQDLVDLSEGRLRVFQGTAQGGFRERLAIDIDVQDLEIVDWNDDGRLDLVMSGPEGISWIENTTATSSKWLRLYLIGDEQNSGRIPRDAFGSLAELNSGERYQAKVVDSQQTHFGLGAETQIAAVRTVWSNGLPQGVVSPDVDTTITAQIYLKGSCPFIYTWNGESFEFFTDCLWAAPIGLLRNRTELVPTREWEYIKIPGDRLRRDESGRYTVQLTEELWEAAYFDQVELIAVDHPEGTGIFSNEKVGPPSIAEYRIHTVSELRRPLSARGTDGEDVSELIASADERYYRGFDQRIVQGLTPEHFLELDLGDLSQASDVRLFLTGWIFPTDTSLNMSFVDHPDRDAPRFPELQFVNDEGEWQTWDVPIGFPGGKTKTIVVDLSGLMPRADGRVRIVTSAEIYWDQAFFTVDEPEGELVTTVLKAESADLHWRGFSRRIPKPLNGPERFDYGQVETQPRWPPMRGHFTRYGNVTELLQETDHRMVVLASGDEMTVSFAPLGSDPPPGWTRDFLLHSVGWDKDADLNTVHGQNSEPLPFAGMTSYPYSASESPFEDAAIQEEFVSRYQTREMSWYRFWRPEILREVRPLERVPRGAE